MVFRPIPYIRFFGRWYFLSLEVFIIIMTVYFSVCLSNGERTIDTWGAAGLCLALSVIVGPYCLHELWEKLFATITITEQTICWKCIFRKKIQLPAQACHVSMGEEVSHWKIEYDYICFSTRTLTQEELNKIDKQPCDNTFVKYRYEPKLAEYVLKTLPKEHTKPLEYFHYMQNKKTKRRS